MAKREKKPEVAIVQIDAVRFRALVASDSPYDPDNPGDQTVSKIPVIYDHSVIEDLSFVTVIDGGDLRVGGIVEIDEPPCPMDGCNRWANHAMGKILWIGSEKDASREFEKEPTKDIYYYYI